jgi:serine phosphatase RsbU (regulator of sigma subunit)/Tfp pilus assembly protein PilF
MYRTLYLLLTLLFCLNQPDVFPQGKKDSLLKVAQSTAHDTVIGQALLDLCWELKASDHKLALEYGEQALNLSRKNAHKLHEATALKNIGTIYLFISEFPKSESYFQAAIQLFKSINNFKGLAGSTNNLGLVHELKGDFDKAMDCYQKSLEINEKIDNKPGIASSQTNIGNILQLQGNYSHAIEYYMKALKTKEELNEKIGIADAYNNIGALYEKQNAYELAEKNYEQALMIYIAVDEKRKSGMALHNLGYLQSQQKNFNKAMDYFERSLEVKRDYGDKQGIGSTLLQIGEIYFEQGNQKMAFDYFMKSLNIFNELGNKYRVIQAKISLAKLNYQTGKYAQTIAELKPMLKSEALLPQDKKSVYHILSQAFFKIQNINQAYYFQNLYITLKDSLGKIENTKSILRLQLDYDYQKKQKELELIKEKQRLHDLAELNKRKMVIIILLVCLVAFLLIVILVYRGYLEKRKDNKILQGQKKEIELINEKLIHYQEELLSQKEDLEVQKRLVINQRDLLEEKNIRINESIQYAKRIQTLLLPTEETLKNAFTDCFVLFKPKDIVSGDFYWYKNVNGQIIVAVADCTGHGVPGAFISLLNMSFLDEIIDAGITNPSAILGCARDKIKKVLHEHTSKNEPRDGMDIGICVIDIAKNTLQYSGAYHSLLILSSDTKEQDGLKEFLGDKMPIGAHIKTEKPFTLYTHKIEKGDKFYLYTDGYTDQFGGTFDRKFLTRKFKDMLIMAKNESMQNQKHIMLQNLDLWMDGREQVDDILVFGFAV